MFKLLTTFPRATALPVYGLVRLSSEYHTDQVHHTQLQHIRRRNAKHRRRDHEAMPKAPKSKKKGNKFYAVRVGRTPGVYQTWDECEMQVKQFPGAVHKAFKTEDEATTFLGSQALSQWSNGVPPVQPVQVDSSASDGPASSFDTGADFVPFNGTTVEATDPVLSPQQSEILKRIMEGENYFFTGSAGTGKSVLLRAIIKAFKEKEREDLRNAPGLIEKLWQEYIQSGGKSKAPGTEKVSRWKLGITASTGMAGVNIGGSTLHSWSGIGLGKLPVAKLTEMIRKNNVAVERWRTTGALIIDEISMVDGTLFDKIEQIARNIRGNNNPFGGLQLIVSGDFFQLPPVSRPGEPDYKFAFEATCWPKLFPRENMSGLTRVFRQKEDDFVKLLEGMRKGLVRPQDVALLAKCNRQIKYDDAIEPVGLYPSKVEVANINNARLQAIDAPVHQYLAHDSPGVNSKGYTLNQSEATECLDRNTLWVKELHLKKGAMVMLVTNMQDGTLVNGSTGIVIGFMTAAEAIRRQIYIPNNVMQFIASLDPSIEWPVIEFVKAKYASGDHPALTLIPQMSVDVMNAQGTVEALRQQIPLILAWALTIHKSQGQTIERVKIDLNKIFVEGQTYVAISRAVSLETLEIRGFSSNKVMAHPRVIKWAAPLEEAQAVEEEWDDLLANHEFDETI